MALFEAGAQGEHKLLRGFVPCATYSNHWIRHPGLRNAVERFLQEEAMSLPSYMRELNRFSPFRRGNDGETLPVASGSIMIEPSTAQEVGDESAAARSEDAAEHDPHGDGSDP